MREKQKLDIIKITSILIIFLGIFLRVWQYAVNRSLWFDEALLALNIVNRTFIGLTQPLDYNQGAPIGFLIIEKVILQLIGNKDYILRLFPLIAGVTGVILMWKVANNYVGGGGTLIVLGLFAVSGQLIYFSSELKQYSSDVMISLLFLWITYKCLETSSKSRIYFVLLGTLGILGIWISHPALFIMLGISLCFMIDILISRDWKKFFWLGPIWALWAISLFIEYLISLRFLSSNMILGKYWQNYFMPIPPWVDINWFSTAWKGLLKDPVGLSPVAIGTIVLLAGIISVFIKRWQLALVLIMPFPILLIVSGLKKYPFGGRLLLFIIPIVFILIAEGIERIRLLLQKINPWIGYCATAALVTLFMFPPTLNSLRNLQQPYLREHIKPILSYLSQQRQDTDSIYVYYGAEPALNYYASQYGLSRNEYIISVISREKPENYIQDIEQLRGQKRVWFLFSHICYYYPCKGNEEVIFIQHLEKIGVRLSENKYPGVSLYLYDLSKESLNSRYNSGVVLKAPEVK